MSKRIGTAKACEYARIDRVKFNAAVTRQHFTSAPEPAGGSTGREFTVDDVVVLFVYARKAELGSAEEAGNVSRKVREEIDKFPTNDVIEIGRMIGGGVFVRKGRPVNESGPAGRDVWEHETIEVGAIRRHIEHLIEYDESIGAALDEK